MKSALLRKAERGVAVALIALAIRNKGHRRALRIC